MATDITILESGFDDLQTNYPKSLSVASKRWADIILDYGMSASTIFGAASPTFSVALAPVFLTSMKSFQFFEDLPKHLSTFWLSAAWVGAGFTRHYKCSKSKFFKAGAE